MTFPSHFGRYRVLRALATGEMGIVYLAEDPAIGGRKVAIKGIRHDSYSGDAEVQGLQARFEQEIQIAGTFSHPNIVTLYDVGRQDGRTFIAMEYVDGSDLRAALRADGPLPAERVARIMVPVCEALDYAHQRDVIHRDIKPTNVLLSADGVPKITDFGVARLVGSTLTRAGKIFGTPAYMSPEQTVGGTLSGASDQFGVAAMVYELLTGERPFKGDSPTAVIYDVIERNPPPPQEVSPLVPISVGKVVMRGLSKSPEARFQTCSDFAEALDRAVASARANPEAAYLSVTPGSATEIEPHTGPIAVRVLLSRGSARQRLGQLTDRALWEGLLQHARDAARSAWDNPLSRATIAVGVVSFAAILAAAAWSGSTHQGDSRTPASRGNLAPAPEIAAETTPPGSRRGGSSPSDTSLDPSSAAAVNRQAPEGDELEGSGGEPLPEAGDPLDLQVSTSPEGARVIFDGELVSNEQGASISVSPSQQHRLLLELEGYAPLTWTFDRSDLTEEHLTSLRLFFPLEPIADDSESIPEVAEERIPAPAPTRLDLGDPRPPTPVPDDPPEAAAPSAEVRRVRAPGQAPLPPKIHHADPDVEVPEGIDGAVVLEIEVSARGNVVQAKVLRGLSPALDQAALESVILWKYEPTALEGEFVRVVMNVSVPFSGKSTT